MRAVDDGDTTVLVVDDDGDVALLCRLHLETAGYRVVVAADGQGGLDAVRDHRPDAVVLDYMLPDMDGLAVLGTLRDDPATANLPIVMLTARADVRDQQAAWEGGVSDYITKPFERDRLLQSLEDALEPDAHVNRARRHREATDRLRARDVAVLERQASIVEHAEDSIMSSSLDGLITSWNRGAAALYGYEADEVVGQPLAILLPPDNPTDLDDVLARVGRGERVPHYETVRLRKDGRLIDVSISLSSVRDADGSIIGVAAISRDVTERRRTDDRFRSLVESAPDATVIVDQDGVIQLVSAQTEPLFGYEREELIGQPVEVLVPERYRSNHPGHRLRYVGAPRVRGMGAGGELHGLRKDGSEFPVEISLSPLKTDEGVMVSAAVRDVTERRRAEQAQAHVLQREREATQRLRQADRLRSDFLSTVSHELRTPLTTITGFTGILLDQWANIADEQRVELIGRVAGAGARLDDLISDLLDFTRLEGGLLRFTVEPLAVDAVVRSSVQRISPNLDGHAVVVEVPPGLVVKADPTALGRTLDNLIGNAAKFSEPGSTITVRAEQQGAEQHLSIADQGMGIPADELERIFDRFYRVGGPSNRHPGTGIGLAIVKEFTEDQGGRVEVASEPAVGTTFTVVLPAG